MLISLVVEHPGLYGFGSCEKLAPETFVVEKDIMFKPKAKVISEESQKNQKKSKVKKILM